MVKCIACGKEFAYNESGGKEKEGVKILGPDYVCYECWESVGFKRNGLMSKLYATHDKASFLEYYIKCHPDAIGLKEEIKKFRQTQKEKAARELKESWAEAKSLFGNTKDELHADEKRKMKDYKKKKYTEKTEEEYTCTKCGEVWYNDASDATRNIYNILNTNVNRVKDLSQCPKCGSRASKHKTVSFWVDKDGNFIE